MYARPFIFRHKHVYHISGWKGIQAAYPLEICSFKFRQQMRFELNCDDFAKWDACCVPCALAVLYSHRSRNGIKRLHTSGKLLSTHMHSSPPSAHTRVVQVNVDSQWMFLMLLKRWHKICWGRRHKIHFSVLQLREFVRLGLGAFRHAVRNFSKLQVCHSSRLNHATLRGKMPRGGTRYSGHFASIMSMATPSESEIAEYSKPTAQTKKTHWWIKITQNLPTHPSNKTTVRKPLTVERNVSPARFSKWSRECTTKILKTIFLYEILITIFRHLSSCSGCVSTCTMLNRLHRQLMTTFPHRPLWEPWMMDRHRQNTQRPYGHSLFTFEQVKDHFWNLQQSLISFKHMLRCDSACAVECEDQTAFGFKQLKKESLNKCHHLFLSNTCVYLDYNTSKPVKATVSDNSKHHRNVVFEQTVHVMIWEREACNFMTTIEQWYGTLQRLHSTTLVHHPSKEKPCLYIVARKNRRTGEALQEWETFAGPNSCIQTRYFCLPSIRRWWLVLLWALCAYTQRGQVESSRSTVLWWQIGSWSEDSHLVLVTCVSSVADMKIARQQQWYRFSQ